MLNRLLFTALITLSFSLPFSTAQLTSMLKIDASLQKKLEQIQKDFKGKAGVYVYHIQKNSFASVFGDSLFPTASMVKVPIMLTIFDKIEKDELKYNEELPYNGEHNYVYEADFINRLEKGTKVSINKLLSLMIGYSDNTASLWLQHLAGTGTGINVWLSANGYNSTRVNSRTPGREKEYAEFGWGNTSPKEMAEIVLSIFKGKAISGDASAKMYRLMSRSFWDGEALSQIPPYVQVASKQGAVSQSKSEVVVVNGKNGAYIFCAMTDKQEVTGYEYNDPGFVFLRKVSKLLYNYFEPQDQWTPSKYPEKYW